MKKILLSLGMIVFVGVVVAGATGAFFSDTETSTGNTLTAGAIDLGVDNTSYYNGVFNEGTSWGLGYDLDNHCPNPFFDQTQEPSEENPEFIPCLFFDFDDLKPGDWGEDTISLHVKGNDSWLCVDVTLTSSDDNSSTEPELDEGDDVEDPTDSWDGELTDYITWYWWADDGDNVYEDGEGLLPGSGSSFPNSPATYHVTLADSSFNVWGEGGPINVCDGENDTDEAGNEICSRDIRYIAKAWCFGESDLQPHDQDGLGAGNENGPDFRPIRCDGSSVNNLSQTDSMTMDLTFRAEQSRNNENFVCRRPLPLPPPVI
jgi:predicted ribosomally synthesized peptide with SipW-like signal peptide